MIRKTSLKRSRGKQATAAERRHLARVAEMPCAVSGRRPVEVHHVISDGMKRLSRDHKRVIPLHPIYHRNGPYAVHSMGRRFNEYHGIDQLEMADLLWRESEEIERGR